MPLCETAEKIKPPRLDLPEGVPALHTFYLYMSDSCNMCCRHCWIVPKFTDGKPDPGRCIDLDALREAVREGKTLGLSSAKLTGGEPMLHPRFFEVVELLTAEGLGLNMETNGTFLTAENARYLKDRSNVGLISISLDGSDAETHDDFRRVPGAYDAALRGLGYLVDAGYKNAQLIMSVHRGNREQVEPVARLAAEHGAASLKLNPVTRTGRGTALHEQGEALDYDGLMDLSRHVYKDLRPRVPVPVFLNLPPALVPLHELQRTHGHCGDCGVRGIIGILGTNEYALCGIGQTCPELIYGQLGQDSLRDIWLNHPVVLYLRKALEDVNSYPGICSRCIFARVCRTGCVANKYAETAKLIAPDWMCAEADRRGFFPSTRAQRRVTPTVTPTVPEVLCGPTGAAPDRESSAKAQDLKAVGK